MSDGQLRVLFREHLKNAHITSIETWTSEPGIPDMNICIDGNEVWVENKVIDSGWSPKMKTEQVAWAEQHMRYGGKVFLCVRKRTYGTPKRAPIDLLYIFHGRHMRKIHEEYQGMRHTIPVFLDDGGPAHWNWDEVRTVLLGGTVELPPLPTGKILYDARGQRMGVQDAIPQRTP
jgi:hypothetical protein